MVLVQRRWSLVALLTVWMMLVAACGGSDSTAESADSGTETTAAPTTTVAETTTSAAPETTAAPADTQAPETEAEPAEADDELAGATEDENREALIEEISAILVEWQESSGAPGASLSVRLPGQAPINIANGVRDIVSEDPVSTEDYFRIASITKPMTAAVVLQLVEEGLVELDEPVQTYIPGWLDGYQYASEITIRQLMDHTNGLIEYAFDPEFYLLAGQRLDEPMEPEEIIEFLATREPLFAPGAEYSYETGGFLSLGRVIETVTGNSAAAEMRARIFEPAGAANIYLTPEEFPPEPTTNAYGRAELYLAGTTLIGRPDELGLTINDEPVVDLLSLPQGVLQSSGWTGGGNEAQLESVSAIFKAMFDGTILSDDLIEQFTVNTLGSNYGLGISVDEVDGELVYSHGGGVPGFRSHAAYLPDHDIAWAVSVNLIPLPDGTDVGVLQEALTPLLVSATG